jgi:hypothetical protein
MLCVLLSSSFCACPQSCAVCGSNTDVYNFLCCQYCCVFYCRECGVPPEKVTVPCPCTALCASFLFAPASAACPCLLVPGLRPPHPISVPLAGFAGCLHVRVLCGGAIAQRPRPPRSSEAG